MLSLQNQQELRWILRFQWAFIILASTLIWIILNHNAAIDLACGGMVVILPSMVFEKVLFHHQGARQVRKIVHHFYVGEALKVGLTWLLFAWVLLWVHPLWWAFFMGFVLAQLGFFIAPCVYLMLRT